MEENEDVGLAKRKMLDILQDPQKRALLQIEMAVTVDGGLPLVQATCQLEGDGAFVFTCYKELNKVLQVIRTAHFPNLNRVAKL